MARKHHPLVALIALILLVLLLMLTCSGCTSTRTPEPGVPAPRFTVETVMNNGRGVTKIITDTETGVQYLYYQCDSSGGLTVLQPGAEP